MKKIETTEIFEQKTIEQMEAFFPITKATCSNCLESLVDVITVFRRLN